MGERAQELRWWEHRVPANWQQSRLEAIQVSEKYLFSYEEEHGEEYAKENKMGFLETSALEGLNVDLAFSQMMECIHSWI